MSEDVNYCHYLKCPNKKCEHHASHITRHYVYHKFEFFKDCVWWDLPEVYFTASKMGVEHED